MTDFNPDEFIAGIRTAQTKVTIFKRADLAGELIEAQAFDAPRRASTYARAGAPTSPSCRSSPTPSLSLARSPFRPFSRNKTAPTSSK